VLGDRAGVRVDTEMAPYTKNSLPSHSFQVALVPGIVFPMDDLWVTAFFVMLHSGPKCAQ
jgi:hypothetical protein